MTTELHDKMVLQKEKLWLGFAAANLPHHMLNGVFQYVMYGQDPGSFLQAVLCNNLVRSFECADDENTHNMRNWATWLVTECPMVMWGSPDRVDKNLGLFPLCRFCRKLKCGMEVRDKEHCEKRHLNNERPIAL